VLLDTIRFAVVSKAYLQNPISKYFLSLLLFCQLEFIIRSKMKGLYQLMVVVITLGLANMKTVSWKKFDKKCAKNKNITCVTDFSEQMIIWNWKGKNDFLRVNAIIIIFSNLLRFPNQMRNWSRFKFTTSHFVRTASGSSTTSSVRPMKNSENISTSNSFLSERPQ